MSRWLVPIGQALVALRPDAGRARHQLDRLRACAGIDAQDRAAATAAPATGPAVSQVPAVDARQLIDNVKLNAADLPAGYGLGGLQGYQTSEMAVSA